MSVPMVTLSLHGQDLLGATLDRVFVPSEWQERPERTERPADEYYCGTEFESKGQLYIIGSRKDRIELIHYVRGEEKAS